MKRSALLLALLLFAPATANAVPREIDAFRQAAGRYWDARGIPAACETLITIKPLTRAGEAFVGGCPGQIFLDDQFVRHNIDYTRNRHLKRGIRRAFALELCQVVVHEEGHARGLEHTTTGIMAPNPWLTPAPHECRVTARRLIPRHDYTRTGY